MAVFYRREYPRLVGALTRYCGDRELAAELAQEAMARAWRSWDRVGTLESPAGWVHRVGINLANSAFRRATVRVRFAIEHPEREARPTADVDAVVVLRQALARLPPRQKTAVVLHYFMGQTYDEVAQAMHCSPGAVRSLVNHAMGTLRRTVER